MSSLTLLVCVAFGAILLCTVEGGVPLSTMPPEMTTEAADSAADDSTGGTAMPEGSTMASGNTTDGGNGSGTGAVVASVVGTLGAFILALVM